MKSLTSSFKTLLLSVLWLPLVSMTATVHEPVLTYEIVIDPHTYSLYITGTLTDLPPGPHRFVTDARVGAHELALVQDLQFFSDNRLVDAEQRVAGQWYVEDHQGTLTFSYRIRTDAAAHGLPHHSPWRGVMPQANHRLAFLSRYAFVWPAGIDLAEPIHLDWTVPEGWQVVTPWNTEGTLADVPSLYALLQNYSVAISEGSVLEETVNGVNLRMVWTGSDALEDSPEAILNITRVFASAADLIGSRDFPERLTLIFHDTSAQGAMTGGTAASSSIQLQLPEGMPFGDYWRFSGERMLHTVAHEIFHTWSYRDEALAARQRSYSDWGQETCWIREGFTDYFAQKILLDAGLESLDDFANAIQNKSTLAHRDQTHGHWSLKSACDQFYQNAAAFYYTYYEGALLAFELDAALQRASQGDKSLTDFMRRYMRTYRNQTKDLAGFISMWDDYAPDSLPGLESLLYQLGGFQPNVSLASMGALTHYDAGQRAYRWQVPDHSLLARYFSPQTRSVAGVLRSTDD